MLKASYLNQRYSLEELVLREYPADIARITERIAGYEKDVALAAAHPKGQEGFCGMVIEGKQYAEKEDFFALIGNAVNERLVFLIHFQQDVQFIQSGGFFRQLLLAGKGRAQFSAGIFKLPFCFLQAALLCLQAPRKVFKGEEVPERKVVGLER